MNGPVNNNVAPRMQRGAVNGNQAQDTFRGRPFGFNRRNGGRRGGNANGTSHWRGGRAGYANLAKEPDANGKQAPPQRANWRGGRGANRSRGGANAKAANGKSETPEPVDFFFDPNDDSQGPNCFLPQTVLDPTIFTPMGAHSVALYNPVGTIYFDKMYPNAVPPTTLNHYVRKQIEYYFSDDNLTKDVFCGRRWIGMDFCHYACYCSFHASQTLHKAWQCCYSPSWIRKSLN